MKQSHYETHADPLAQRVPAVSLWTLGCVSFVPSGSGMGPGAAQTHSGVVSEVEEVIWGGSRPKAGFVMLVEKHKGMRPHRKQTCELIQQ